MLLPMQPPHIAIVVDSVEVKVNHQSLASSLHSLQRRALTRRSSVFFK